MHLRTQEVCCRLHIFIQAGSRRQREKLDNGLAAEVEAIVGVDEPTIASAILNQFVHNAYYIELKGKSMRKINARRGRRLKAKVLMYEGYEGEP